MYKHYKTTAFFTVLRLILDAGGVFFGLLLAYYLRFYSGFLPPVRSIPPLYYYQMAFPIGTILVILFFRSYGFYTAKWRYNFLKEFFLIIRGVSSGLFVLLALGFFYREFSFSRVLVALAWPTTVGMLAILHWAVAKIEWRYLAAKRIVTRALIAGGDELACRLYESIRRNPYLGYDIKGFVVDGEPKDGLRATGVPLLGQQKDFAAVLDKVKVDEVILSRQNLPHGEILKMIIECEKRLIGFKMVPDVFEIMTSHVDITNVEGIPLLGFHEFPLRRAWPRFVKRQMDVLGSALGLVLFCPLLLVVAAAVKLSSKGPVFYGQERCGEDGKVFTIYKYRTMVVGAEQQTGPVWAKQNDSRRTPIGSFLRRTNLDELPQLWNVLRGDMSLVGPRPERPHFVEKFKQDVPRYMSRHHIRSGLTGWAQVNGLRGDTSIEERIKYDLYYIEHWSVFFDMKILLMTMIARKNAY